MNKMSDSSPPETKRCKICAEEINRNATICIHCKSYQDWRSAFGFSTTALSLIVALVSVLTVALPVMKDVITPKNSYLTYTVQGSTQNSVYVLISNLGSRPGSITSAALYLDDNPAIILDLPEGIAALQMIGPGMSELVEYHFRRVIEGARIEDAKSYRVCELYMRITDFRGQVWWAHFPAECIQFTAFLENHQQAGSSTHPVPSP
jgi:hypothetical protein